MAEQRIAAAYIRVSTEDQTEYSPDAQLVEIRQYAERNGYTIPNHLVFSDEGLSGKRTAKREGFHRMIGMAKEKPRPFDAILLWKFSRFARNREDSVVYKSMLRKQLGIEVISVSEPVGDDKMSILIEALIEAMDEYYSINLAEEVKRGMTEKARRGELQATPAFGYCVKEHMLSQVPEEAELVRAIFERFAAGEGAYQIAKWMNDLGVRTHRGRPFENRSITYILQNPVYIGKLRWNPGGQSGRKAQSESLIVADGEHDALISQKLWETVQNRIEQERAEKGQLIRADAKPKEWFSGLVRCADCGSTLIFAKPHYWKCNGYVKGACSSSQHTTSVQLQEILCAAMRQMHFDSVILSWSAQQDTERKKQQILCDQMAAMERRKVRLREAYLAGVETLEGYSAAKKQLSLQQEQIEQQFKRLTAEKPELDTVVSNCIQLFSTSELSTEVKYRAAHAMIESCRYEKENRSLKIVYRIQILP